MVCKILLIVIITTVVVANRNIWSGIGFTVPATRFCQPCFYNASENVRTGRSTSMEQLNGADNECRKYVELLPTNEKSLYSLQRALVATLEQLDNEIYFIFFARLAAQIIYEKHFNEPYTLTAYIEPNERADDDFCIFVHMTGRGFSNNMEPTNISVEEDVQKGIKYEKDYLNAIFDYWVITTCNKTVHGIFISKAKNRFTQLHENALNYNAQDVFTPEFPIQFHPPSMSGFPECGKRLPYRQIPIDGASDCTTSFCGPSSKKRRILQPINAAENEENAEDLTPQNSVISDDGDHTAAKQKSSLFINEIYACKPNSGTQSQFIELREYPARGRTSVTDTKVVVVSTVTLRIVTVVNIHRVAVNEDGFLALHATDINVHVSKDVGLDNNLLPCSTTEPFVVLLLHKPSSMKHDVWNTIKLNGRKQRQTEVSKRIDVPVSLKKGGEQINLATVLKETVVDAYFYGRIINAAMSETWLTMLPAYASGCNFVLSVGQPDNENEEHQSISLCPDEDPSHFMYKNMKLSNPTPGEPNNCPTSTRWLYQTMEHNSPDTVGVTSDPNNPEECPSTEDVGDVIAEIEQEIDFISKTFNINYRSEYYPVPDMSDYILTRRLYDSSASPDLLSPFERVPDDEKSFDVDGLVQIRCKICQLRLSVCPHSIHSTARKEALSQKKGIFLPTNEAAAKRKLKRHLNRKQHYYSILYEIRHYRTTLSIENSLRINREVNNDEKHLAAAFLTSFTLLKTNTAVHNSKTWFRTLSLLNADVSQHWTSEKSVWNLMNFVSNEGHVNLQRNMMEKNLPFSFLLDASSDRTNTHYVLFFIQTTEGEYSIVYFFGLIKLGKSSTADAYMDSIKTFVSNSIPGFEAYFKTNCVALITDAASTMTKLHSDFNTWIDRKTATGQSNPIISLFCLSHKLQLVSRNSLIPLRSDDDLGLGDCLKYFTVVESMTQNIYTFVKLSSKRIAEFRDTAAAWKQPNLEIVELHTQRWISSEHRTVKNFLAAWITTTKTMEIIINDVRNYPAAVRDNAIQYLAMLHDKDILVTLVFLQDYTSAFKVWSEHSQYFAGLLIEHELYYYRLQHELALMHGLESPVLTSFLQSCKCSASPQPNEFGCKLDEYESSETIWWRDQMFVKRDPSSPTISLLGTELIKKTFAKIEYYIPRRMIDAFGVLQPYLLSPGLNPLILQNPGISTSDTAPVYGKDGIIQLAIYFNLPLDETLRDWSALIQSMVTSVKWEELRKDTDTNSFWARAIKDENLSWTDLTRKLIRSAKAVSGGTAVVESGFSQFSVLKNQKRCRLTDDHVGTALSLLINGPENVDTFDSYHYANMYKRISPVWKPVTADDKCSNIPPENENDDDECMADDENVDVLNNDDEAEINSFPDIYDNFLLEKTRLRNPTRIRSVLM